MDNRKPIVFQEELSNINLQGKDYLLWIIFRLLKEAKNKNWITDLFKESYKANFWFKEDLSDIDELKMNFWFGQKENIFHPPATYKKYLNKRLKVALDEKESVPTIDLSEDATEIDLVLQSEKKLIFIETMLEKDIEYKTIVDPIRDQLSRILDVGSDYAKRHKLEFFFILITPDLAFGSRLYHYRMHDFFHHPLGIKEKLPHRMDLSWHELSEHIGWLTWEKLLRIWERYIEEEEIVDQGLREEMKKVIEQEIQWVQA